jgi:hypothetical protein
LKASNQYAGGQIQVIHVCVGTGHHTKGPTAKQNGRLAAAMVEALKGWDVRYRFLQPGLIEVHL